MKKYLNLNLVDWNLLSNSILNKFAPGHAVFKQQLNKIKNTQINYVKDKKIKEDLVKKAELRKLQKKYESSTNMSELKMRIQLKKKHRERFYSNHSELKVSYFHYY